MASPILEEKNKKNTRTAYLVIGIIGLLVVMYFYLAAKAYQSTSTRIGLGDALSYVLANPTGVSFRQVIGAFKQNALMTICIALAIATAAGMFYLTAQMKAHDNPNKVHSAHFLTAAEKKQYDMEKTDPIGYARYDGPNNIIFSKEMMLAIDNKKTRRNTNVLVIGGSGAGKSFFFISPNILQYNANFVVTDPSGELVRDYGKALEDNGYKVKVFNLTDVYRSSRYNPFHYIKSEKDVFVLVNTLIKNTTPPESHSGDPFWEKSEKLLIEALVLYLWHTCPPEDQTFYNVVKLVNMGSVDENDDTAQSPLDKIFENFRKEDPDNLAIQQYDTFKLGAGKTLKSILISVGVRLETFKLSDIQYLTETDEMEFENFADTRQALFIVIPTADTTFNFIVSLLYSQLFMTLYNYCETEAEYGWQANIPMKTQYRRSFLDNLVKKKDPPTSGKEILKVEQAKSAADSDLAKEEIERYVKDIKMGTRTKYNKEKHLYELWTKRHDKDGNVIKDENGKPVMELVAWRGTKEMINEFKQRLTKIKVEKCSAKCPNHVRFLLDEFANIGEIPDFDQKVATIRKYEISVVIVLQAISQLQQIYDKKWNTLAGNCDAKILLGSDDSETLKWFCETGGKTAIRTMNESYQKMGEGSTSINNSGEDLLTPDKIALMGENDCIVRIRGLPLYWGPKYKTINHPNYKYAQSVAGKFKVKSKSRKDPEELFPFRERTKKNKAVEAMAKAAAGEDIREKTPEYTADNRNEADMKKARRDENKARRREAKEADDDRKLLDKAQKEGMSGETEIGEAEAQGLLSSMGFDAEALKNPDGSVNDEKFDTAIKENSKSILKLIQPDISIMEYKISQ